MKFFLSLLLLVTLNSQGFAAESKAVAAKDKKEMTHSVDLKKSQIKWTGTKVSGKHWGTVNFKSADIKMVSGKIASGTFVVDMNSMDVTDLEGEWKTKFLGHMKNDDFFKTNKFPTATFKISNNDGKKLSGDLTILGKTNKVEIPYSKKGNNYEGKFKFDRTKFGIKYGSGDFFKGLGDKMIHNDVTLDFKIVTK